MWRAMASLLVLRDQVNALAPDRSTASDGLVGDAAHQATTSDHNPHYVAGVGSEIVTALDLTHDPAGGFDSYLFAEILRQHRDKRIKYVISNRRIFASYGRSYRSAWTWGDYSGDDPHTNHVHISVLDDPIADTRTPWNLEGFIMLTTEDIAAVADASARAVWNYNFGSRTNVVTALARVNAILAAAQDDSDLTVQLPPDAVQDLKDVKVILAALPKAVVDEESARLAE